uniref:Potassium channel domain-containing protein n=1 Tax=Plectus sambesii TaxID=2011161 RepID=A0A914UY41_9BILA
MRQTVIDGVGALVKSAADMLSRRLDWKSWSRGSVRRRAQSRFQKRLLRTLKILLPHVGLTLLLLTYIGVGALIFQWLEGSKELERRREKLLDVMRIYRLIFNETNVMCNEDTRLNSSQVERRLHPLLNILSRTHEYDERFTEEDQMWTDDESELSAKWTWSAAVLYALTVITTTGYDHVTPSTNAGRLFTVFFGLLGIPLMFITAADIGKFLSEMVTRSYSKLLQFGRWIGEKCAACREKFRKSKDDDSLEEGKCRANGDVQKDTKSLGDDDLLDEEQRVELPILSYFGLILGNVIYLCMIVFYVIVGLAVITMCVDLASSQLKVFFTKLHYFGRKFRGARGAFANMSDDIREAMKIIAALKKTRPSKERITLEDLKRFLEVQEQILHQPFVPSNVGIFRWIEDEEKSSQAGRTSSMAQASLKHTNSEPMLYM